MSTPVLVAVFSSWSWPSPPPSAGARHSAPPRQGTGRQRSLDRCRRFFYVSPYHGSGPAGSLQGQIPLPPRITSSPPRPVLAGCAASRAPPRSARRHGQHAARPTRVCTPPASRTQGRTPQRSAMAGHGMPRHHRRGDADHGAEHAPVQAGGTCVCSQAKALPTVSESMAPANSRPAAPAERVSGASPTPSAPRPSPVIPNSMFRARGENRPRRQRHAAGHQTGAPGRTAPGYLGHAAAKALNDEQRQQAKGRHDEKVQHHGQPADAPQGHPAPYVGEPLPQIAAQRGQRPGGAFRLGHGHKAERHDGHGRRGHVQQHDAIDGHERQQQAPSGGAAISARRAPPGGAGTRARCVPAPSAP